MRFKGKVAIVTGAGSKRGIGQASVLAFAREGATVVVTDLDLQGAEKTAQAAQQLGVKTLAVKPEMFLAKGWGHLRKLLQV